LECGEHRRFGFLLALPEWRGDRSAGSRKKRGSQSGDARRIPQKGKGRKGEPKRRCSPHSKSAHRLSTARKGFAAPAARRYNMSEISPHRSRIEQPLPMPPAGSVICWISLVKGGDRVVARQVTWPGDHAKQSGFAES
jgi:hypothetical protein